MNVENVVKLRDFIKCLPEDKFSMMTWLAHNECGTVGCIAGWGSILFGLDAGAENLAGFAQDDYYIDVVGEVLGLTQTEARLLFLPSFIQRRTKAEAVEVLDQLLTTGIVNWPENG